MRYLRLALKLVCYLALAFVVLGIATTMFVDWMDGAARPDQGTVRCMAPFCYSVTDFDHGQVLVMALAGLLGPLAVAGLVLLIRDLWRWRRKSSK